MRKGGQSGGQFEPQPISALKARARSCLERGQFEQAWMLYSDICNRDANDAEAWMLLGAIDGHLGRHAACVEACRRSIALQPANADAHFNLAQALMHLGRLQDAVAAYTEAERLRPGHGDTLNGLAIARTRLGDYEGAERSLRALIAVEPNLARAHNRLASILRWQGRHEEALAACEQALRIRPQFAEACVNLGSILLAYGRHDDAEYALRNALQLNPADFSARSYLLLMLNYARRDPVSVFEEHREWERAHIEVLGHLDRGVRDRDPARRLRVGYVSADLRAHSVAYFVEPLLAQHDPAAIEAICYSDVERPDATTARLREFATDWRDLRGMRDEDVAALVVRDRIDILVDLAGHTAGNRLRVFARRPAPIQVSYLGYPNTTGLRAIDYRISDAYADPPGLTEHLYTEKLVRLSGGFLCYQPPRECPPPNPRPAARDGRITFGSFNKLAKVTPDVIALWSRVLHAIPRARLLLKNRSLRNPSIARRYRDQFADRGISADRVELIGWMPSSEAHLRAYDRIDIALDTFPYNGTTTTCEALWMGVPVITLEGRTHAGRVGASLLQRLGIPDLIARSEDEYVDLARSLADRPERLQSLSRELRVRFLACGLCDGRQFARELETCYRAMWDEWCRNGAD